MTARKAAARHEGRLIYQSTSDAYQFDMNGRTLYFERGELDAMIELLRSLGRVDAVQVPANDQVQPRRRRRLG